MFGNFWLGLIESCEFGYWYLVSFANF